MKKFMVTAACLTLAAGAVYARQLNKEQRRLEECGVVMQEVLMRHRHPFRQKAGFWNRRRLWARRDGVPHR
jgi:hypothetical protein